MTPTPGGQPAALRDAGWETVEVEPAEDCPDSVFVEDAVVAYAGLAVLANPGAEARRAEVAGTAEVLEEREHLAPLGADVITVSQTRVLHLKSAVTALPDGTVVGLEPLVQDPSVWGERFLPVPEESGAHVVLLGGDRVLMAADAPEPAGMFRERGLEVVQVDISEFEKLEGCVTCLSVRLRGVPG